MAEESLQEDGDDIRRRALIRLGVAAIVTSVALAGLWWLDQSGKQDRSKAQPPAKPIISAAPPAPLAPLDTKQEETTEAKLPAAPPPPEVGKLPPLPPPEPAESVPAKPAATPAKPAPIPSTKPEAAKAAETPAKPATPATGGHFVVQLGVFSNMDNAKELVERLTKLGIKAQTETRVQVGPFLNRAEAEKAQAEMRKLGLSPTVTTNSLPAKK